MVSSSVNTFGHTWNRLFLRSFIFFSFVRHSLLLHRALSWVAINDFMDRRIHRLEHFTPTVSSDFRFSLQLNSAHLLLRINFVFRSHSPCDLYAVRSLLLYVNVFCIYPHSIVRLKSIEMRMESYTTINSASIPYVRFSLRAFKQNVQFVWFFSCVLLVESSTCSLKHSSRLPNIGVLISLSFDSRIFVVAIESTQIEIGDFFRFFDTVVLEWIRINCHRKKKNQRKQKNSFRAFSNEI